MDINEHFSFILVGDDASMVSKRTKKDMSPFIVVNDDPDNNFVVAGENDILTEAEGMLEAVEVLLMTYCFCYIHSSI